MVQAAPLGICQTLILNQQNLLLLYTVREPVSILTKEGFGISSDFYF